MKGDKKNSSSLIGKLTIKKNIRILFQSSFFLENFSFFFVFLGYLATSHFLYLGSVDEKLDLQSNEDQ